MNMNVQTKYFQYVDSVPGKKAKTLKNFYSEILLKSSVNHGYSGILVFFVKQFGKKY